ncbi:GNAT family N-acetyltransferase [Sulfitobacter guttiformis]|uniref:Acetyltransferase (GNAT) family protein n=1 Tax=Sulfitobacter guttiformis TaxID=74349 RepID=A0A420DML9_9RHOB|nr:GNAT family N-acetyltransferase [Sulfitobacter guttiformis]KIN72835.1 Acetyltransferase [Sulfitobacter guttiformis KCTC 32187]RKE95526.1 acetyltransferase (GNAT) family protein [Sulfitobacter guttiformis]
MTLIRPVTTSADLDAVRQLCWDYRSHIASASPQDAKLTEIFYPVPKYTTLMEGLARTHARPHGMILIAVHDAMSAGCAMSHALDPETCEIKRMYVTPRARGNGIARKLLEVLLDQARKDGFSRVQLDTSKNLVPARALYASMGLSERGPYGDIPAIALPHLVFFEASL